MKKDYFIKILPVKTICLFALLYGVTDSSDTVSVTNHSTVESTGIEKPANPDPVAAAESEDSETVDTILMKHIVTGTAEKNKSIEKTNGKKPPSFEVLTSGKKSDSFRVQEIPVGKQEKPVLKSVAGDSGKSVSIDTVNHLDSKVAGKNKEAFSGPDNAFLTKTKRVFRKIATMNPLKRKQHSQLEDSNGKIFTPDRTATEKPLVEKTSSADEEKPRDTVESHKDTATVKKTSPVQNMKKMLTGTSDLPSSEKKTEWRFFKAGKVLTALFVFFIGWLVLHYITMLMNLLSERWPQYRLLIKGFIPVVRIVGWTILLSFIIIGVFKPPIQSVLAFTASAGIAIGFASQDILKNIFGGIVILFDKPFKVGDKIQIDSFYGEVISIGIRTVRIVTMDDSVVAVPNSEIVSKSVSNANSGEPDCQVAAEFYFEPDLNLDKAFVLAQQCAAISRYIYLNKPIAVVFKNEMHLGRNMIHMRLKAYVIDHRFEMPFITDMSRTVYREFRHAGLIDTSKTERLAESA